MDENFKNDPKPQQTLKSDSQNDVVVDEGKKHQRIDKVLERHEKNVESKQDVLEDAMRISIRILLEKKDPVTRLREQSFFLSCRRLQLMVEEAQGARKNQADIVEKNVKIDKLLAGTFITVGSGLTLASPIIWIMGFSELGTLMMSVGSGLLLALVKIKSKTKTS